MLSDKSKRVASIASKIYEEKYREILEKSSHGEFVCIEPKSGEYFLGATFDDAVNQAIDAYPNRLTHTLRVGHVAAIHLGVMTQ